MQGLRLVERSQRQASRVLHGIERAAGRLARALGHDEPTTIVINYTAPLLYDEKAARTLAAMLRRELRR